jgi:hypothetical protein
MRTGNASFDHPVLCRGTTIKAEFDRGTLGKTTLIDRAISSGQVVYPYTELVFSLPIPGNDRQLLYG